MIALAVAAGLSLSAWLWLILLHGGFWRCDQRLGDARISAGDDAPPVTVVIPARNEAESIGQTIGALLAQDYPGRLDIILVDDSSTDGTAGIARQAAGEDGRLRIITNSPLPEGWVGKMWAVNAGLAEVGDEAAYVLLTDADIRHAPDLLSRLVAKAESESRVLVSLMVRLNCETFWEKLLIPAFVYYFQKLYPFRRVNDPANRTAAAAGGCMLADAAALRRAGGVERIRNAIIDDCALARELAKQGPVWLGLASRTVSLRRYDRLSEIWDMVARTAYTQLGYSPLMLAGSVIGMLWLYLLPPVALLAGLWAGDPAVAVSGGVALLLMCTSYLPVLRLYRQPAPLALTLPVAGLLYGLMTLSSGYRHWRGRGGGWKGRTYRAAGPSGGNQGSSND
jgi:hopene-associated glycosyltransferase HpnB